jgi:hypothetical protein
VFFNKNALDIWLSREDTEDSKSELLFLSKLSIPLPIADRVLDEYSTIKSKITELAPVVFDIK